MAKLFTTRELTKFFKVRWHVLTYAIATAELEPAARISHVRVFSEEQLPQICEALQATGAIKPQPAEAIATA